MVIDLCMNVAVVLSSSAHIEYHFIPRELALVHLIIIIMIVLLLYRSVCDSQLHFSLISIQLMNYHHSIGVLHVGPCSAC